MASPLSMALCDREPEFLPVETILKEDDGSILITTLQNANILQCNSKWNKQNCFQNKTEDLSLKQNIVKQSYDQSKATIRMQLRRQDPSFKDLERQRQKNLMKVKRENILFKLAEREQQRKRMQNRRSDPRFREEERQKQRERMHLKRLDPNYRAKERLQKKNSKMKFMKSSTLDDLINANHPSQNLAYSPFQMTNLLMSKSQHEMNNHGFTNMGLANISKDFYSLSRDEINPMSSTSRNSSEYLHGNLNTKTGDFKSIVSTIHHNRPITHTNFINLESPITFGSIEKNATKEIKGKIEKLKEPFYCIICGLLLESKTSLKYHQIKQHNQGGQFKCEICDKQYSDRSSYARHVKHHTETFVCPICDKVFHMKQHLKEHLKSHGEKNLCCLHCNYRTCYKYALNRHISTKHSSKSRE